MQKEVSPIFMNPFSTIDAATGVMRIHHAMLGEHTVSSRLKYVSVEIMSQSFIADEN